MTPTRKTLLLLAVGAAVFAASVFAVPNKIRSIIQTPDAPSGNILHDDGTWSADDDVPEAADFSNLTAGRSLTAPSVGTIDADVELYEHTKCVNIESPADADNFLFFRAERAITLTGIDCLVGAATSAVVTLQECDSSGGSCGTSEAATCSTTNTTESAGIDDAAVDAGDWMRVDIGTVTGSVGQVAFCVTYTVND